jgi:hypothetical protein
LAVSSKLCMPAASASTSTSCILESDCPSTWTCECPSESGGAFAPAGGDSGVTSGPCTKQCTAPNQDLSNGGFGPIFAAGAGPATSGPSNPAPSVSDAGTTDEKRTSPASAGSGCALTRDAHDTEGWLYVLVGAVFAASARRRRNQSPS